MWEPLNTDTSSDNKNMENMMYDGTLYDSETDVVKITILVALMMKVQAQIQCKQNVHQSQLSQNDNEHVKFILQMDRFRKATKSTQAVNVIESTPKKRGCPRLTVTKLQRNKQIKQQKKTCIVCYLYKSLS